MSKRECKKKYINAEIGLSDSINCLMFDHFMDYNESLKYLGL